jgi:hypothetical protein
MALITSLLDIRFRAVTNERKTAVGIQQNNSYYDHVFEQIVQYANGTGSNKVDSVFSARFTGTQAIDLRGSLTSVLDGSVVNFPIVTGIFLANLSVTTGESLTIGGGSNPFISWLIATGDGLKCGPSGMFVLTSPIDGYATTAATADILTVTAAAGSPQWDVMIVGRQS